MACPPPYSPIDEKMALPASRILRALRFFDWVTTKEISIAAEFSNDEVYAFNKALARLVKSKRVARRESPYRKEQYRYRITSAGRKYYDKIGRVNMRVCLP